MPQNLWKFWDMLIWKTNMQALLVDSSHSLSFLGLEILVEFWRYEIPLRQDVEGF